MTVLQTVLVLSNGSVLFVPVLVSINDNYKYRVKSCIQVRESARRFDQLLLLYDDVGPESDWGRDTEISCDLVSVRKHITIHCSSGRCLRAFQGLAGWHGGAFLPAVLSDLDLR